MNNTDETPQTWLVDPPEGYKYGFPMKISQDPSEMDSLDLFIWLVEHGYPSNLTAAKLSKRCRFWLSA